MLMTCKMNSKISCLVPIKLTNMGTKLRRNEILRMYMKTWRWNLKKTIQTGGLTILMLLRRLS